MTPVFGSEHFYDTDAMSPSDLPQILTKFHHEILEDWLREQLNAEDVRRDLISESELRSESEEFLSKLQKASESGETQILKSPSWVPVLEMLADLSRQRTRKGFSASETASFILSLKSPVMTRLHAETDSASFFEQSRKVTVLLDRLGLYTTEVYQKAREAIILRQQEEMLELSTPVVKLWEGIVALPLIGTLDSARTTVVMESLLQRIVETGSEMAIIDITGVPTVDTLVAQHLLKTVAAARLMGADCIISGIRPQIAQTMVHLAIDLSAVTTKATMAEALRTALQRRGVKLTRVAGPAEGL